ncbi:MAG: phosphopantothenoylcysteine decarboxylase [Phycisphaerales bacterium]
MPAPIPPSLLVTAGPTHEPIDAVRYIANRSSGRMGCAIADEAAGRGWRVRLLLGPAPARPAEQGIQVDRFATTAELGDLLDHLAPQHDALVMAAAVADYRPAPTAAQLLGKIERGADPLTLRLEPTPDLLARAASRKRPDQVFVGFALEPRGELASAAPAKLVRKGVDLLVANPLETMDAQDVEATLLTPGRSGADVRPLSPMSKHAFAKMLVDEIESLLQSRTTPTSKGSHA